MKFTIPDFIQYLQNAPDNPTAFNFLDEDGKWQSMSMAEVVRQVRFVASALKVRGLKKGDKVAIIAPVSHLWTICDLGIMLAGCVTVSIFHNISAEHFTYEVEHSEAKFIFTADKYCHQLCHDNSSFLKHIVSLDDPNYKTEEAFNDFLDLGKKGIADGGGHYVGPDIYPDDLASIIYTAAQRPNPKA